MTASDVPTTTGAPDNGCEGMRFLGFPVFEGLVLWDLTRADKLAEIRPGLAESWEQDKNDKTKWIFHLRKGVKFHDGTDWNADAAIWNLDRFLQAGRAAIRPAQRRGDAGAQPLLRQLSQDRRLHDRDRQPAPDQLLPEHGHLDALRRARRSSRRPGHGRSSRRRRRAQARSRSSSSSRGSARRWRATRDIGTRPGCRSSTRWSCSRCRRRRPGCRRCAPARSIGSRCRRRMRCRASNRPGSRSSPNSYPHTWPWVFNLAKEDSPLRDIRVRHAINYCVNRDGLVTLLNGLAEPAYGAVQEGRPVFRQPEGAIHLRSGQGARRC